MTVFDLYVYCFRAIRDYLTVNKTKPVALSFQELIALPNYTKLLYIIEGNGYIKRCIKYNKSDQYSLMFNYHCEDLSGGGNSGSINFRKPNQLEGCIFCIDPNPEIEANYTSGIGIR